MFLLPCDDFRNLMFNCSSNNLKKNVPNTINTLRMATVHNIKLMNEFYQTCI